MKSRLYICIKNPLTKRDIRRLGILELAEHYDLRILDCTAWLMPIALRTRGNSCIVLSSIIRIDSLSEFKKAVEVRGGFALDYVGPFSPKAIVMFEILRQRAVKLIVVDSGAFPAPQAVFRKKNFFYKFFDAFRHGNLCTHLIARFNRLLLSVLPDQRPNIALVAGESWRIDPRFSSAHVQISAHSFDYEHFRDTCSNGMPKVISQLPRYAVYLDENIEGHEDNAEMGLSAPTKETDFYPALNKFFDRFEHDTGLKVVIAAYPSRKAERLEHFGGRRSFFDLSAELIRGSHLVFAHASTAISFAVLARRPIVFLTSREIASSWYGPWIESPSSILHAPLVFIDTVGTPPNLFRVDESAFALYEDNYIKSKNSPDYSLWDILIRCISEEETILK
jgi:hypothetical protein